MKRYLTISILIIISISILIMLSIIYQDVNQENKISAQIYNLPDFEFDDIITKRKFTNQQIQKDIPIIFIYFNTECEHCKYEISEINNNIEQFDSIQVVLISIEEPEVLLEFFKDKKILGESNFSILYDKHLEFEKIFGQCPFPTSFIYNKKDELLKVFKGEVKIEAILKYLNN